MGGTVSAGKPPPPQTVFLDPAIDPTTPDWQGGKLSHDPQYGFEGKRRKERVMVATEAEMKSAKVPHKYRDFCAHKYIDFERCKKDEFPYLYRCAHERHAYGQCQYEDVVHRMKEFERERRLLMRKQRKEAAAAKRAASHSE